MSGELGPLHEIILYVRDMQAQVRFYRDTLGLTVVYPPDLDDEAELYWVVFDTGSCSLALHAGGNCQFGSDAPKFVFRVEDIEAARARLADRRVSMSDIRSPAPGVRVVDCRDAEGNQFSLESSDDDAK